MQPPEIIQDQGGPLCVPQQGGIRCKARSKCSSVHILRGKQNVSSSSSLPQVPLNKRSEALYVEDQPRDEVGKGPVTPEAPLQSVTPVHYSCLQEEEKMQLICRFPSKGNRVPDVPTGPNPQEFLLPPCVKDVTRRLPTS